jgi:hypothetical protein
MLILKKQCVVDMDWIQLVQNRIYEHCTEPLCSERLNQ